MSGILKLLLIASVAVPGLGELFTSIAHLQTALYAERDIAEEIRDYIQREEEKLNNLRRYQFILIFNLNINFCIIIKYQLRINSQKRRHSPNRENVSTCAIKHTDLETVKCLDQGSPVLLLLL